MNRYRFFYIAVIVISVCSAGSSQAAPPIEVFVSIAPQKYFVQQIGKDRVLVHILVPPGADPHTYEPRPRQMAALSRSRLYFTIGIGLEAVWLPKILADRPGITRVPLENGISKIPMESHHHDHHWPGTAAQSRIPDPHIWLSPPLVMQMAQTIQATLQQADPANRIFYQKNGNRFMAELQQLHNDLRKIFSSSHQQPAFMVFHPSWGYFAKAYHLKQIPIELEGKAPKPSQLKALIDLARKNRIKVIFAQPQVSDRMARLIAREIQGRVIFIDPLAENWMQNLRLVAGQFQQTFH